MAPLAQQDPEDPGDKTQQIVSSLPAFVMRWDECGILNHESKLRGRIKRRVRQILNICVCIGTCNTVKAVKADKALTDTVRTFLESEDILASPDNFKWLFGGKDLVSRVRFIVVMLKDRSRGTHYINKGPHEDRSTRLIVFVCVCVCVCARVRRIWFCMW